MIQLLHNMYSKIKAQVKVKNRLYCWITDTCGTNQGGPLSPNMFRHLLHDLKYYLNLEKGIVMNNKEILLHILWADDLILVSDTKEGLQRQLNGVFTFCSKSQMIVNSLKTKIMIFGKKQGDEEFTFNSTILNIVDEYKYLGVVFNSISTCNQNIVKQHVPYIRDKALKASFMCFKKCRKIGFVTPKVGFQLFNSFVSPLVNYGCEIWSTKEYPILELVHLKFLKLLLGVKTSTCNMAIYAETGRYPLDIQHKINCIKYWCRLTRLEEGKIVKQMYNMLKELCDLGFNTWCSYIKEILQEHGFIHLYEDQDAVPKNVEKDVLSKIESSLQRNFRELCLQSLSTFPVLRTYIHFKKEFKLENYLVNVKDFKLRKCIASIRLSSHTLFIETGRHQRPKIESDQRICKLCSLDVENEFHFILKCPLYENERNVLLSIVLNHDPTIIDTDDSVTFNNLMMSCNDKVTFSLGKYIQKCFKKRRLLLL